MLPLVPLPGRALRGGYRTSLSSAAIDDIALTYLILGLVVVAFVANKVAVELVAIGAALALWATGVLELDEAISGFGDPTVLFIASLFVVSEGLDATGTTTWAGQKVIALAGDDRKRLTTLVLLLVAVLTALITVNGAVAALLPMVVIVAVRTDLAPSRILMPLAFAAHAGSQLALTGTPVNVLVSGPRPTPAPARSGSSTSRSPASRSSPGRSPSSCCSATACCRSGRRARCRRT